MKIKMVLIIVSIIVLVLLGAILYMRQSCTGLWERQVSKIPHNLFSKKEGVADDYTKCVYIGFSGMITNWKEKKLELSYQLTTKKNFIAKTFDNISFQYPLVGKYENIEQRCAIDSCELLIKNDANYILLKVLISKADNEDFNDWLTTNGDLLGQQKNKNGVSYSVKIGDNKNPTILFLNRTKVFERGDELSGIKFEIIYISMRNDNKLENVRNFWMTSIVDSFSFK